MLVRSQLVQHRTACGYFEPCKVASHLSTQLTVTILNSNSSTPCKYCTLNIPLTPSMRHDVLDKYQVIKTHSLVSDTENKHNSCLTKHSSDTLCTLLSRCGHQSYLLLVMIAFATIRSDSRFSVSLPALAAINLRYKGDNHRRLVRLDPPAPAPTPGLCRDVTNTDKSQGHARESLQVQDLIEDSNFISIISIIVGYYIAQLETVHKSILCKCKSEYSL